jgi:hypothetical protein
MLAFYLFWYVLRHYIITQMQNCVVVRVDQSCVRNLLWWWNEKI